MDTCGHTDIKYCHLQTRGCCNKLLSNMKLNAPKDQFESRHPTWTCAHTHTNFCDDKSLWCQNRALFTKGVKFNDHGEIGKDMSDEGKAVWARHNADIKSGKEKDEPEVDIKSQEELFASVNVLHEQVKNEMEVMAHIKELQRFSNAQTHEPGLKRTFDAYIVEYMSHYRNEGYYENER